MPNQIILWYSSLEWRFEVILKNNFTMTLSRTHSCRKRSKQVILLEDCKVKEQPKKKLDETLVSSQWYDYSRYNSLKEN